MSGSWLRPWNTGDSRRRKPARLGLREPAGVGVKAVASVFRCVHPDDSGPGAARIARDHALVCTPSQSARTSGKLRTELPRSSWANQFRPHATKLPDLPSSGNKVPFCSTRCSSAGMLLREMVGTTRFELATSPTPRVRSTRLSHVPTCYILRRQSPRMGCPQCTPAWRSGTPPA